MSTFDISQQEPRPQTPAVRRASQKRAAADRARRYREKAAEEGLPVTRETDQAIVEALSFVSRRALVVEGRPLIDLGDIVTMAGLILKRGGKAKRPSLQAVRDRISYRPEHEVSSFMPSTCQKTANQLYVPNGRQGWTYGDVMAVRAALDRHNVERSQPDSQHSDYGDFIGELIAGLLSNSSVNSDG